MSATGSVWSSQESLLGGQSATIEEALYAALRAVEEKVAVLRRLGARHADMANKVGAGYEQKARDLEQTAEILRSMLAGAEI